MAALRNRMLITALLISLIIGACAAIVGGSAALLAAVIAAVASSLLCFIRLQQVISSVRDDQFQMASVLLSPVRIAELQAEPDGLIALESLRSEIISSHDTRWRVQQELLKQVFAAQEKLHLITHEWSTGDELGRRQVQDAVAVMERLNTSFCQVISEIDVLSGRTEERASISTQMSATTEEIADNINQYSDFVVETSSSIEEMARAIRETAYNIRALSVSTEQSVSSINMISVSQATVRDNSERSSNASESVRTQAQQGLRSMSATMKAMQEIARSNDESFESINRLARYSVRVGDFLSIIREVVEQTNLLSLNASIIAAQAGSRGRAFAVVAEEVRSLARRTSSSTKEIEELVRNIQKETASVQHSVTQGKEKVKEGVKISTQANDALVKIDQGAEDAFKLVSRIAVETTEQAVNIQRITEEAEKNLELVRQVTLATEQQQHGAHLIVNNLEQMRDLTIRINISAQEQAKGNRLYLASVVEDNDRTRELKNDAASDMVLAKQAVEAIRNVEAQIGTTIAGSQNVIAALAQLTRLLEQYRSDSIQSDENEGRRNV
jgi:methyl-accepting chemotaxis protein